MKTVVIKNALPLMLANAVYAEFPRDDWRHWHHYNDAHSKKYGSKDPLRFPTVIHKALSQLGTVIEQSGIYEHYPQSFIDYEYHAAGIHMIPSQGHLAKHTDASRHPILPWKRTLSACWYATPDWEQGWGGELKTESECLTPEFNTLVIFEANQTHEVLKVTGPEPRRVLSIFCWELNSHADGDTTSNFNV